jgi:hypothetical protein
LSIDLLLDKFFAYSVGSGEWNLYESEQRVTSSEY